MGRLKRQRDLLPLPYVPRSAEDVPQRYAAQWDQSKSGARATWLWLVVVVLNFGNCLRGTSKEPRLPMGPITLAQQKSSFQLETYVEDWLIDNPHDLS